MPITERRARDVTILDLSGPLVVERFGALKDHVAQLVRADRRFLILNLAQVPYIDSIGVAEIVRVHTMLSRHGGHLTLVNMHERVQELLKITGLLAILDHADDERGALDRIR